MKAARTPSCGDWPFPRAEGVLADLAIGDRMVKEVGGGPRSKAIREIPDYKDPDEWFGVQKVDKDHGQVNHSTAAQSQFESSAVITAARKAGETVCWAKRPQ